MNAIIVLVLCVTALGTVVCQQPSPFVVGGVKANPGDVPWMVSLSSDESNGKHFCGGSILDSTHILTAYHCVNDIDIENPKTSHLKARIGSLKHDQGGVQYDVAKVTLYSYTYDAAILCLDKIIVLDNTLPVPTSAVQLPTGSMPDAGTVARVAGWGYNTTDGQSLSPDLLYVNIPIVSEKECRDSYRDNYMQYYHICAGADGKGACVGDAGGPLTIDGVQYGIVSFGSYPCTTAPGVYSDIANNVDWINTDIQTNCYDVIPY